MYPYVTTCIHPVACLPQWSTPVLQKLEVPVDVDGNPWPLDESGKPIEREYHPIG
jgi:hypothetical protein